MNRLSKTSILTCTYTIASALYRLLPHWPNIAPFTALAFWTGNTKTSRWSLAIPLIPLACTDLFLGWHATIPFVYGSLILIGLLGRSLHTKKPLIVLATTLISSLIFFIITNFGAWLTSGLYPHTSNGLITAFTLAIPFYQNAIIGDLAFSLIFFGAMQFSTKKLITKIRLFENLSKNNN